MFFSLSSTGRVAALSMMGRPSEFKTVPYFWSAMFGKTIRYAGGPAGGTVDTPLLEDVPWTGLPYFEQKKTNFWDFPL